MKKILAIVLLAMGVSGVAHAGFLIEPYLGYNSGTSTLEYTDLAAAFTGESNANSKYTATAFGARIGYMLPMRLWFAADVAMASGKNTPDNSSYNDTDFSAQTLGLDVGFDLPFLARFWAGYIFSNSATFKGTSDTKYTGTGMKVGVGFKIIPKVSLNFEYITNSFTKFDSDSGSGDLSDTYKTNTNTGYMVSLSVPLP
jgi:hypothetical protein